VYLCVAIKTRVIIYEVGNALKNKCEKKKVRKSFALLPITPSSPFNFTGTVLVIILGVVIGCVLPCGVAILGGDRASTSSESADFQ